MLTRAKKVKFEAQAATCAIETSKAELQAAQSLLQALHNQVSELERFKATYNQKPPS